ncbi:hypothetical protein [Rubinisphaera italica]|uniref:Thioredoxin domain-containing protein n=1 Tax=Rubinisphaera italica TaxID=2527969 RepID=A0A5C5XBK9_9PLAN|nr:hypothetical protein [Rubinisphaera italica]TWT60144.1 hypothetical protein Pan54_08580 [Rubinisphaera italica]
MTTTSESRITILALFLIVLCLSGLGCGSGSTADKDSEPTPVGTSTEQVEDLPPWVGRWMLVITEQTTDFHPFLVQIGEFNGQRALREVDKAPGPSFESWKMTQVVFREDEILLSINIREGVTMNFVGELHGEAVLGAFFMEGELDVTPARLVKTSATSMSEIQTPDKTEGTDAFESAIKAKDKITALQTFIKDHPDLPLTSSAYYELINSAVAQNLPLEKVEEFTKNSIDSSKRWGPNLVPETLFQIATLTKSSPEYRSIARSALDQIKEIVGEPLPDSYAERMDLLESQYLLSSDSAEDQQSGGEKLQTFLVDRPFEINGLIALATHFEKTNKKEEALKIYSKLAVLPGLSRMVGAIPNLDGDEPQTALQKVESLSEKKGDELTRYLDEAYEKEAFYFVEPQDQKPTLKENRKIPLLELFTGSACPPCVAGDLALGGLEKEFPSPEIIAVRYHQHIPRPDPLTNSDSEARFSYYGDGGTPTLIINGRPASSVGGFVFHAENHYEELLPIVGSLINEPSSVVINLDATAEGDKMKIKVEVSGVAESRTAVRLRLLIVDPLIHFDAPNGIRLHEMVVRDMPAGTNGIAIKDGKATFEKTVSISELKAEIMADLNTFQKNRGYQFEDVPSDFTKLKVVAFVQDDDSRLVLQSTISPDLEFQLESAPE